MDILFLASIGVVSGLCALAIVIVLCFVCDKDEKKIKEKIKDLEKEISEIKERHKVIDFNKKHKEGAFLYVRHVSAYGLFTELDYFAVFTFMGEIKEIKYDNRVLDIGEKPKKHQVYKNTENDLIIFDSVSNYIKIDKSTGAYVDVSDLIKKESKNGEIH